MYEAQSHFECRLSFIHHKIFCELFATVSAVIESVKGHRQKFPGRIFLRIFFFISLVVLCLLVLFITNNSLDIEFPTFDNNVDRGNHSCPTVVCPEVAQPSDSSPNCSKELLQMNPLQNDNQKIQAAVVDTEPDTILLIWMWPFGNKYELSCSTFNITKCLLTDDKSLYQKAHGVLFHHRDIHGNLAGMPTEPRPWFQKWVWSNMESPANSPLIPELNHLFNLTCNYRLDSDIPVPYGYLVPLSSHTESFKLPTKDKLVCWIVSNWNSQSGSFESYNVCTY